MDVDENGFIVDKETCEYVEPYAFSKDAFMESVDVAENPFDEYFVPLSETPVVKNTERTHLTDLHTINKFNGEVHPVKDDMFNISKMARNIGITYSVVTAWSDCIHFVESEDDTIPIYWEKESDVDMNLNCFGADCDYSGGVSNWIKDNSDELICPQCEVLWDTKGIAICNECNCTHQSEDIHMDSYSSDMYCPDCNKTIDYESIKNRYDIM